MYPSQKKAKYRADIDGLRAIAVLAVVFYHATKNLLNGGFVGVDVFFVISGFLITGILIKSFSNQKVNIMRGGRASSSIVHGLISFYARRVRRIFPILIVVLISCIIAGWFLMTPDEYQLLGKHIAGGSVYISNIILWKESGYFDISSEVKPLLHLWSLGIEEQFYIIWPFVIIILLKLKLRLETFILIFLFVSFVFNISLVSDHPTRTFFSPHTRFWELAIGGFLAALYYQHSKIWERIAYKCGTFLNVIFFANHKKGQEIQLSKDILSIVGFLLILYAIFFYNTGMPFPGVLAFIPTLGAFFIIAAGENAFVNKRLLSLSFMVFIGLISYPLYLWHWPLLSFARILYGDVPPLELRIFLIILAILLSWLTYRFIEPPLRWGKHSRIKAIALFVTLLSLGLCGINIYKNSGYPQRVGYTTEEIQKDKFLYKYAKESEERCLKIFTDWKGKNIDGWGCKLQRDDKYNTIAIVGDSHAERLFYGLSEYYMNDKDNGIALFSVPSQSPFINLRTSIKNRNNDRRYQLINNGYKYIFDDPKITTVILAHFPLSGFCEGFDYIDEPNNKNVEDVYSKAIRKTFDALKNHNKKVIYVLDNPYPNLDPHQCAYRPVNIEAIKKDKCFINRDTLQNKEYLKSFNKIIANAVSDYDNIKVINSFDLLCDKRICPISKNGKLLYMDSHHLSYEGSRIMTRKIVEVINKSIH